jgi:hypothetical protein
MPSSIRSCDGAENDSRASLVLRPSTKNALPDTYTTRWAIAFDQRVGVHAPVERGPQEESAPRLGPRHEIAELAPKRLLHHETLRLVTRSETGKPRRDNAALPHVVDDPLIETAGAKIGRLLGHFEFGGNCRRSSHPRVCAPREKNRS